MRAELICVGTELLLGDIVNTNAARIGQMLAEAGIDHYLQTVVGDNEERIAAAIGRALERADAVIVTGGIGPTQDDVTREAIAQVTGAKLVRDEEMAAWLRKRFSEMGREMPEMNLRQADRPDGARVIEQSWGTAPGLIVEHEGKVIYAIPGVPAEMEDMMHRGVVPDMTLRMGASRRIESRVLRVAGMSESAIAAALHPLWERIHGVTLAFLAGGGEVRIRMTVNSDGPERSSELLESADAAVRATLGSAIVGPDPLEIEVGRLLLARGWMLGAAESLTGGALGARATRVPGASEWFRGSIVSYATDVKASLLDVDEAVLEDPGPVSEIVARQMARGAREKLKADVAVALTGVAGPIEQGKPVGTVVLAVDGPLGDAVREVRLPGDRETIRTLSVAAGLNLVRLYLMEET